MNIKDLTIGDTLICVNYERLFTKGREYNIVDIITNDTRDMVLLYNDYQFLCAVDLSNFKLKD